MDAFEEECVKLSSKGEEGGGGGVGGREYGAISG